MATSDRECYYHGVRVGSRKRRALVTISLPFTKQGNHKCAQAEQTDVNVSHKHLLCTSSIVPEFMNMNAHISVVLSLVVKGEAFSSPFAFIIAAALPIAIDIAPV